MAFGLIALGAEEIRIVDIDQAKARLLARTLQTARPGLPVIVTADFNIAAAKADGLINCTPVGMVGHGGTPLPRELMSTAAWAFDVVYTPLNTQFLQDAKAEGLDIMSGYELFFYQGINAFEIFCDQRVDEAKLRDRLISDS